jgi:hypothetical protein
VNEEGKPVRDKSGLCIKCLPGEAGEFVGKIVKGNIKNEILFLVILCIGTASFNAVRLRENYVASGINPFLRHVKC